MYVPLNQADCMLDGEVLLIVLAAAFASVLDAKMIVAVATIEPEVALICRLSALENCAISAVPNDVESKLLSSPPRVKAAVTVNLYAAPGATGGGNAPGFEGGTGGDRTTQVPSSELALES